jgi:hypothetical protein
LVEKKLNPAITLIQRQPRRLPWGRAPPWADRFILRIVPIDYGPVLLLMPFRFHLTVDTLPSEVRQVVTLGRSWPYPAFAFVPV